MIGKFHNPYGGSGTTPDWATECPIHGYIIDPGLPYTPPIDPGIPSIEEIILLCTNNSPFALSVYCTISTGKYYIDVYDSTGTFVETTMQVNSNTILPYYFPTDVPGSYYVLKIKVTTGVFQAFKVSTISGYSGNWQILYASFNTPNLTSLVNAFLNIKAIRGVDFISSMDNLTSMATMFSGAGIISYTMPHSLPALTTASSMFTESDIYKIFWDADANYPSLVEIGGFVQNCNNVDTVQLPNALPELTGFSNFSRTSNLRNIRMMLTAAKLLTIEFAFYDAKYLEGDILWPEMTLVTNISTVHYDNFRLNKIKFQGLMYAITSATGFYDIARNCTILSEFEFPRETAGSTQTTMFNASPAISKLKLPDIATNATLTNFASMGLAAFLTSITGEFDNSIDTDYEMVYAGIALAELNCVKMKCSRLELGATTTHNKLTRIDIDWANSSFNFSTTPLKLYCNLDATELDRIFGLLPTITGKTLYIKGNPGTATCTQSIATAKGWTVNTTT